jgi:hypothetical protein
VARQSLTYFHTLLKTLNHTIRSRGLGATLHARRRVVAATRAANHNLFRQLVAGHGSIGVRDLDPQLPCVDPMRPSRPIPIAHKLAAGVHLDKQGLLAKFAGRMRQSPFGGDHAVATLCRAMCS